MIPIKLKQHSGFSILSVILVIVSVITVISVWALSGQTNTPNKTKSVDIGVASLFNDSANIKLTFDQFIINGADYSKIVFKPNTSSTPSAPNILDPIEGILLPPGNPAILKANYKIPDGVWIYNPKNIFGDGVGVTANADPTILMRGLTDVACQKITFVLTGSTYVQNIGYAFYYTNDITATNLTTTSMIHFESRGAFPNATMGCFSTSIPNNNVFFRILKAV